MLVSLCRFGLVWAGVPAPRRVLVAIAAMGRRTGGGLVTLIFLGVEGPVIVEGMTHTYAWGNNHRRAALKGRRCRILASGTMGTVLIEFANGERVTTSRRALRRIR